jgi:DNA-binding Xre family transcriptional regulator
LAAGFTQVQLGAAIGMSYVQIQKYESAANRVAVSTLVRICHALDLSPMDFIGCYFEADEPADNTGSQQTAETAKEAKRPSFKKKPNDFRWSWHPKRKLRLSRG